jgi:type IV pilus assembly protein PilW
MRNHSSHARAMTGLACAKGFSLIELMIAMTLSLLISAAMAILFQKVGQSNREQFKSAQQIENGRYATELMANDIRHAGYYGEFGALPLTSGFAALPDPCDTTLLADGDITTNTINSPLAFYIQGYNAATLTTVLSIPTACQTYIDNASLKAGSDMLVVRRLDTLPLIDLEASPARTGATATDGEKYVQATADVMSLQTGLGTAIDQTMTATGAASVLTRKDYSQCWNNAAWVACPTTPTISPTSPRPTIAAPIRKLRTHVYYVSNCRRGTGANGKCAASDDTIPTLKRLELTAAGGSTTMTVVPLVEGIEFMKLRYGIDSNADGTADSQDPTPAFADWQNVVQVDLRVIARNVESTNNATDPKSYDLGSGLTYTPSGTAASYKRHLYSQQIYITNIGGTREK